MRRHIGVTVFVLLSFGILLSVLFYQSNKSGNMALSKTFHSVDELCSESDLIVTVTVTDNKELFQPDVDETLKLNAIIQKVIVNEVMLNNTSIEISMNDQINYASYDGYIHKETGNVARFFESIELKPGKYLLFLKRHAVYRDIFVNNSLHNLYKLIDINFTGNMDLFKNEIGLALPVLSGKDVLEAIQKVKVQE